MNKKGFTLVELIVTMVLLSIVMIFLFNLLTDITSENNRSSYKPTYVTMTALLTDFLQNKILENGITNITNCSATNKRCFNLTLANSHSVVVEINAVNKTINITEKDINNEIVSHENRQLPDDSSVGKITITSSNSSSSYANKYLTIIHIPILDSNNNEYLIEAYYPNPGTITSNLTLE